jgi:hypothetical protein
MAYDPATDESLIKAAEEWPGTNGVTAQDVLSSRYVSTLLENLATHLRAARTRYARLEGALEPFAVVGRWLGPPPQLLGRNDKTARTYMSVSMGKLDYEFPHAPAEEDYRAAARAVEGLVAPLPKKTHPMRGPVSLAPTALRLTVCPFCGGDYPGLGGQKPSRLPFRGQAGASDEAGR